MANGTDFIMVNWSNVLGLEYLSLALNMDLEKAARDRKRYYY